jgi:hypothetical protein
MSSQATRTAAALLVSAMLLSGCLSPRAIPSHSVPLQVAEETTVRVWVRTEQGLVKTRVRLLEGWWIASPYVVEGR